MAKLQTFNGGLATRVAEHLIGINSAIVYTNIDSETGELKPVKTEASTGETLQEYATYFEAESKWVDSAVSSDYLEYQSALFKTSISAIPTRQYSIYTDNLGIAQPSSAPSVATGAAGVLTGTYQYVYTYYSSRTGAESAPSALSAEVIASSQQIELTSIVPAVDPQADKIKIYRVGGLLTILSLVATIDSALTVYTDNIADTSIPGDDLVTEGFGQALLGAKDIKEGYGILFYTLGDKLYFSEPGTWYNWPASNFIDFDKDITGYGFTARGILVFTLGKTYLITGDNKYTFTKSLLSGSQGCKQYRSVVQHNNGLFWISQDGFCFSAGGLPEVVSRNPLGKLNVQVTNAVLHDDVYYVQQVDNSIIAVDMRYGVMFKTFTLNTTRLLVALDSIYGYFGTQYKKLFTGNSYHTFYYTSPKLLDGAYTERKSYKSIYIRYSGNITIAVIINNRIVNTVILTGEDTYEIDIDQKYKNGYFIQFTINGTGTVKEIDYIAISGARP